MNKIVWFSFSHRIRDTKCHAFFTWYLCHRRKAWWNARDFVIISPTKKEISLKRLILSSNCIKSKNKISDIKIYTNRCFYPLNWDILLNQLIDLIFYYLFIGLKIEVILKKSWLYNQPKIPHRLLVLKRNLWNSNLEKRKCKKMCNCLVSYNFDLVWQCN
jgi:hypothetical protein